MQYTDTEFEPELDELEFDSFEFSEETELDQESPLDEAEEMELAAQLLEITDEAELDQFLGKLFKKVWKGVKKIGKPLGGILKSVAKVALPIAGTAAGTFFGGPLGGMIGGKIASGAGKLFGLELEGLSGEDQEFEVARRYVRFAAAAAKRAGRMPPRGDLYAAARRAAAAAARRHAPGLFRQRRRPRRPRPQPFTPVYSPVYVPDYQPDSGGGYAADEPIEDTPAIDTADEPADADTNGTAGELYGEGPRRQGRWVRAGRNIVILNYR